jgi:D-alanine--poly(phosphoribitol) ligase subunit 2
MTPDRIQLLIEEALSVDVPDADTDLIESGLIDSLALVTMIVEIEQEFQVELRLDELDVDRFRSVNSIAELLAALPPAGSNGQVT